MPMAVAHPVSSLLQVQASPFANTGDDYLANAGSCALCVVFVICILLKIGVLSQLSELQRYVYVRDLDNGRHYLWV